MDILERYELMRNDPWLFLEAVHTKDEADPKNPIKRFPIDKEYLKLYTRFWAAEKKIAVPKSRRLIMSWTNIALYTWDTLFHAGRSNAFVSKKEEDASDLVEKARFIVDHLDRELIPAELIPRYEHTYNKLKFPEIESQIRGFPQGADQLRQYTFSGLLFDEVAFWEDAENAYSAAIPTVDSPLGGRITMISSPGPGFFRRVVLDRIEIDEEESILQG